MSETTNAPRSARAPGLVPIIGEVGDGGAVRIYDAEMARRLSARVLREFPSAASEGGDGLP